MYHKTDHSLNRQINDLSKFKVNLSFKRILISISGYLALLPVIVHIAIVTKYDLLVYVYLIPLGPIVFVTYLVFTGKLKWLIKIAHKLLHTKY